MHVYFITGVSKGIGFELTKQLSHSGNYVVGMARTKCEVNGGMFIQADLAQTDSLEQLVDTMFSVTPTNVESFTLINNAGMVDPIGLMGTLESGKTAKAIALNLTAPILLSNGFISKLKDFKGVKRIVNISSGAGRNAYEGWGAYCTTKAGIDHFSRVVALEQKNEINPVGIVSIAPGIINTGMQESIRASDAEGFPLLDRFIAYKEQGKLSSAEETAKKLINFIESESFSSTGTIVDIRDF